MNFIIKTFGCQQNVADSERITSAFIARRIKPCNSYKTANYVIINTCMIRQSAENRVGGLVNNLLKIKEKKIANNEVFKIIVTGCMVGMANRDKTGKYLETIKKRMPYVDEFLPIEEVGFNNEQIRQDKINAFVPISNGCNNYCSYCVVPYARGKEISRLYDEIINECKKLKQKGYKNITLLGQNVNSYGTDLITNLKLKIKNLKPIYVKHLGRYRIPTLFPYLLEEIAKMSFEKVDFMSSNPWDFSDELINVIATNKNITRTVHLPVQSGDSSVLKRMNRWYSCDEYLKLVTNLKLKISNLKLTTDIIVGFCGETDEEFNNTVKLVKEVGFEKAYISMYSQRPLTYATKKMKDDISHKIKKKRWIVLNNLINKSKNKKIV